MIRDRYYSAKLVSLCLLLVMGLFPSFARSIHFSEFLNNPQYGVLWRIHQGKSQDSYIFAVAPIAHQRLQEIPLAVKNVLKKVRCVSFETLPRQSEYRWFEEQIWLPPEEHIHDYLPSEEYGRLHTALVNKGVSPFYINKLKPWRYLTNREA